jgi:hypothetical protein
MSHPSHRAFVLLACAACAPPEAEREARVPPPPPPAQLEDDGDRGPARDATCPEHVPFIASVRTRVVDSGGVGLADVRVQLCVWTVDARMLCLEPGRTNSRGDVDVEVAAAARCMVSATARVLLPQSRRPALYCDLELFTDDASLTVADPFLLLEAPAPVSVPPLGDEATAREVDLGGIRVEVTPAAIGADEYARLAGTMLTLAQAPGCLAAQAPAFDALVAFSPEVDIDGPGFSFSIDNTLGLEEGESAALFVQGGIDCRAQDGTLLEKGAWHRLGDATVVEQGARIAGAGASGLPCLGWIGLLR